jgi:hypothetical protein
MKSACLAKGSNYIEVMLALDMKSASHYPFFMRLDVNISNETVVSHSCNLDVHHNPKRIELSQTILNIVSTNVPQTMSERQPKVRWNHRRFVLRNLIPGQDLSEVRLSGTVLKHPPPGGRSALQIVPEPEHDQASQVPVLLAGEPLAAAPDRDGALRWINHNFPWSAYPLKWRFLARGLYSTN